MKHTSPTRYQSRSFLCFVRDENPTVEEFVAWLGEPGDQGFHVLRKHGVVVVEEGRVRLNRRHLSPDGQRFVWGSRVVHLNEDIIDFVRWGPERPPVYSAHP